MTEYMRGAWIDTDAPMYLVRVDGVGENIVRNGDLITAVLSGQITHPDGPMWLSQSTLDRLTILERKGLAELGIEIKPIPVTIIRREA